MFLNFLFATRIYTNGLFWNYVNIHSKKSIAYKHYMCKVVQSVNPSIKEWWENGAWRGNNK